MSGDGAPSREAVAKFYDDVEAMRILFGDSIHLGYWAEGWSETSLAEAQDQLTDLVAAKCRVVAGGSLLDIGCGTGGPARRIARSTGAQVTGVSVSPRQVETAAAASRREGVGQRTEFRVADAAYLPFADAGFDAAVAIESVMHMPDKAQVFREIYRVLRPGAILSIADVIPRTKLQAQDPATASAALLADSLVSVTAPDAYPTLAADAGSRSWKSPIFPSRPSGPIPS